VRKKDRRPSPLPRTFSKRDNWKKLEIVEGEIYPSEKQEGALGGGGIHFRRAREVGDLRLSHRLALEQILFPPMWASGKKSA